MLGGELADILAGLLPFVEFGSNHLRDEFLGLDE